MWELIKLFYSMWYLWIILAAAIYFRRHKAKMKGIIGEKAIGTLLLFLPERYTIINNIMLRTTNGYTSQIDHVVISPYGVFVIETKNYAGKVSGKEKDEKWIHYVNGRGYSFQNPIRQNYGHVKALEALLKDVPHLTIIPLVAFDDECTIDVAHEKEHVMAFAQVNGFIKRHTKIIMSNYETMKVVNLIQKNNIQSKEITLEHVKWIQERLDGEKEKVSQNICPKCGGGLVERQGKHGVFHACSNYPTCKFMAK